MKALILGSLIIGLSACTSGFSAGDGMVLAGSPEAIQSFGDMLNGFISNTKTVREDGDSSHWQLRKEQETERTKRLIPPSFWSKLTGGSNVK